MIKIIEYIFILFLGISLIVIAFLFRGFEIDNFVYKNINIQKLYLKYDKKLNISTENFLVYNRDKTKSVNMGISFSVDYVNSLLEIDVKEFHIDKTDVKIKSLVYLDLNLLNVIEESQLHLKRFNIIFDKELAPVRAEEVTVNYKDNLINAKMKDPYYLGVNIEGSTVSYSIDKNTLEINIQTKSLLNKTIKDILFHYNVKINTIQHTGNNKITTKIIIPFGKNKVLVSADVLIKNSKIEDFNQIYEVNKSTLHLKGNTIKGIVDLNNYKFQDINITNSLFNYSVDLSKKFDIKVNSKKVNIKKDKSKFQLQDANFYVKDENIHSDANLINEHKTVFAKITNHLNLKTKTFEGKIDPRYENPDFNILVLGKDVPYNGQYGDNFKIKISNASAEMIRPHILSLDNFSLDVVNSIVKTDFIINDKNNNIKLDILNTTDLNLDKSMGNIDISNLVYKDIFSIKNKNIAFDISFENEITLHIPIIELYYKKRDDKIHEMIIKKPEKLFNSFTFLQTQDKTDGFIKITSSENLQETKAYVENLNLSVNSEYFTNRNEKDKTKNIVLPIFPKLELSYLNSNIKYGDFTFLFDKLNLKTNENILDLNLIHQNTQMQLHTEDNSIELHATKLSDKYLNTILDKEVFEEGYVNMNIYGEDINFLSGDINLHQTTIKNITVINNLITFINTTPAIINPLLALPTLFRLSQTGFDINGYYVENGDTSFRYNMPNKQLDIYDLYTNGKLSNFIVNSHLDFKTKKIAANIDISFFKDFTNSLNYIPILGYIIMGDDGEFHTSVDITGTIDDPILETHTVKEATNGVTGILKRIITLPIQPFLSNETK